MEEWMSRVEAEVCAEDGREDRADRERRKKVAGAKL